jgi:hypothetical protein
VLSIVETLVLSEDEVLVPSFIEASKRRFESASSLLNSSIGSERTHPEYSRSDFMKVNTLQYIMYHLLFSGNRGIFFSLRMIISILYPQLLLPASSFLNCVGVFPVICLNVVLNTDFELKPDL